MKSLSISPASQAAVLALNNVHAQELSFLDASALRALIALSFCARVLGNVDAFLLALDHTADYASPNYAWLKARFQKFIYVDRVAVAAHARRRGLAQALYADLFELAKLAGHDRVVCEINAIPPNLESDAFHCALGFEEVGRAELRDRARTVRYLARCI